MIIIINGPLGVGKTQTSWELLPYFERGVMLDGDHIAAVHPSKIYDDERIEHLYQTMRHLVAFHQTYDYYNFVINYVFETPETLARLRTLLSEYDHEIYAFRLTCAEAEIARRIRQRSRTDIGWELRRFRELTGILEAAARRGDVGQPVDTTKLTIDEAADAIWRAIRSLQR
jgi:broad-specificity NMP kinase